jgi:hypothetical protein
VEQYACLASTKELRRYPINLKSQAHVLYCLAQLSSARNQLRRLGDCYSQRIAIREKDIALIHKPINIRRALVRGA